MGLEEIYNECLGCTGCALYKTRTNLVFGDGNERAKIMLVGEGPGENEDLQGLPFVGRGGELLSTMMEIIDLKRESDYYVANIVKCRPPKNRDPSEAEQAACEVWLTRQLNCIKPRIVVCLGRIAAKRLIRSDFKITSEHGRVYDIGGVKYMALYHPAALLRDDAKRPETFVDLKTLKKLIVETCPEVYAGKKP